MDRINHILNHDLFILHLEKNREAEADRRFCRHGLAHFLDVARIGEMINLESGLGIPREWIYAAALLHDLGKHVQYETGEPHELASAKIAPQILADCGFEEYETNVILNAIRSHRNADIAQEADLRGVLYRADKASRACFACEAEGECSRKGDRKNLKIRY